MEAKICHDCGVSEGEVHELGCDMERCPICGVQLIGDYKHFVNPKTGGWKKHRGKSIEEYERVPYFQGECRCYRCGRKCLMWDVPDEVWLAVVPFDWQDKVLCWKCFKWIYTTRKKKGTLPEGIKLPRRF